MRGYTANWPNGFAARAYIAKRKADVARAVAFEFGDEPMVISCFPLHVVKYPMRGDKHLIPADLTTNAGWAELNPWEA